MISFAQHSMDIKMTKYLDMTTKGVFVEAGANNGLLQSNTALLEKEFGWKGLLIEPSLAKFKECQINRPNSICEHGALVSDNYLLPGICGDFSFSDDNNSLTSIVMDVGDFCDDILMNEKSRRQRHHQIVEVPAVTLNALFRRHNISNIDFCSLDVEGYEISVLNGLDFEVYRPKYFLIETANVHTRIEKTNSYMYDKNYEFIEMLSGNDSLFKDKTQ